MAWSVVTLGHIMSTLFPHLHPPDSQDLSIMAWSMMTLGHVEGGRRVIEALSDRAEAVFARARGGADRIQHQSNFGWALLGLAPDRTDLLAKVRGGGCVGVGWEVWQSGGGGVRHRSRVNLSVG